MINTSIDKIDSELKEGRAVAMIFSDGCSECKKIMPEYEELEKELPDVQFFKIDATNDRSQFILNKYPNFVFIKDKKPYSVIERPDIKQIENALKAEPDKYIESVKFLHKSTKDNQKKDNQARVMMLKAQVYDLNARISQIQNEAKALLDPLILDVNKLNAEIARLSK